jgi:hypothetical protein
MGQPVPFSAKCAKKCRHRDIALVETSATVNLLAIEIEN